MKAFASFQSLGVSGRFTNFRLAIDYGVQLNPAGSFTKKVNMALDVSGPGTQEKGEGKLGWIRVAGWVFVHVILQVALNVGLIIELLSRS